MPRARRSWTRNLEFYQGEKKSKFKMLSALSFSFQLLVGFTLTTVLHSSLEVLAYLERSQFQVEVYSL